MSRDRCLIPVARAYSSAMMAGRNRVGAMESGFDNECGCRARRFGCAIDHFSEPSHVLSLPRFDAKGSSTFIPVLPRRVASNLTDFAGC